MATFTLSTATVASNGATIALAFTGIGTAPLLPSSGDTGFTVKVNGIARTLTSATASGSAITLTPTSVIAAGDVVVVSYVPGNVTDSAGTPNTLAANTGVTATNSSTLIGLSGGSIAADGRTITLTVAGTLTAPLLPASAATGITISVDGGARTATSVSCVNSTVVVVLNKAVSKGRVITAAYASGNITDSNGTPRNMSATSGIAVTNASTFVQSGQSIDIATPQIFTSTDNSTYTECGTSSTRTVAFGDRLVNYRLRTDIVATTPNPCYLRFTSTDTNVEFHYTFNGRTPTSNSPKYAAGTPPILYQNKSGDNTRVKVRAFDISNKNRVSAVVQAELNVKGGNTYH